MKIHAFLVLCFVGTITSKENETQQREKRLSSEIAELIGAALSNGATLASASVSSLLAEDYSIAVAGSIENYSKWFLKLEECELVRGQMNVPMHHVRSGYREGFASHKTGHTATGSYQRCTFKGHNNFIHIMYSAPYSFDLHKNWLGVAICPTDDNECREMTADKMYYQKSTFASIKEYYENANPLMQCRGDFCFTGVMGTNHKPKIDIKIYPKSYDNLSTNVKSSAPKDKWTQDDYKKFIDDIVGSA
ncbi:tereporin-Ca1-like [Hydractinia symbiolongicarpus]|uniref:tereporin-Ca1-like n=1 Tax=Hydractinia symbiolongicarpus TaxID=13093 RepID=UPI00254ED1FE|nr:tereporin-Ca1-like [Hydractinia symbiolongicarpus]